MTDTTTADKPEALRCAEWLEHIARGGEVVSIEGLARIAAGELRYLHALVAHGATPEALQIVAPNEAGNTMCIVRWQIETPAGWVGAWDKAALKYLLAACPKHGWISVDGRLPMEPDANASYEREDYIVTDGVRVTTCGFARGNGCGKPWADWCMYGDMRAGHITHWQPLPPPPAARAKEGKA